ncbi:MAG: hypothetical protein A2312_04875 [Candidatus Staskawiczbacteria bacterium RIFOXYB2_FULL_32_9]|uniref:Uncharacterized protein n=1 Tax=Candidatus Staskawiczbacteria bacterium RIFOXYD1_FULL_32_13 TaxID=1802234 RepID=A0A1G2JND5_9BACT|nr:MAG: hypothetical protein UR22_C0001G0126 [Parcubacteria group bacterium GW2011_GWC2_32_10]OGZ77843.1 MAG: hypothetical protein A2360_04570 [Candidatus Staskawiczbacteria bacterium RIFOXYB1_FULL_32_11]OGZ79506.1 MAG: hypothetical protein A2256_03995 [Candidatus Staskawiczbacteria bacterium RIFOXYA2_FULL_32_7]OGZ81173.1 MAG: hypothetical protein A2312_04875 [Candidatus Staskawiczbacteria bacterium RIFOXYB2_FULL_32_9]OGZ87573.1 MAG: hypothetical protein A2463_04770 [Candidatus Staskawiczbacter
MINKILGYVLLIIGLIVIFGVSWQSYNIFNGKIPAPEIFSAQGGKVQLEDKLAVKNPNSLDLQAQLDITIQKQLKDMIPADILPKILNLISFSMFAGILILVGSSLAGIGTKLLKI